MKQKIGMVIPYIGHFPETIDTFLYSCGQNSDIDWLIFTDQPYDKYVNRFQNVFFFETSLLQIKNRITKVSKVKNISLDSGYKLCDYKPLYGAIFKKYLQKYDYWGYSDMDVMYGDLTAFIKRYVDAGVEKIGRFGHFTLMKNTNEVNHRFLLPISKNGEKVNIFEDIVTKTNKICHFDESEGINIIFNQNSFSTDQSVDLVGEILYENLDLYTTDRRFASKYSCFTWIDGHAFYFYDINKFKRHEYGYFHFQKRKFTEYIHSTDSLRQLVITTSGYHKINGIEDIKKAMKNSRSPLIKRLKYISHWYFRTDEFSHKKAFGIYLPIHYILWRIIKRKDFKI